ncbi:MAG: hypothetical protein JSS31_15405 [Proteobacteria bacterium]|nr:hypothetical protein [Pseudomonadota bacterium]MBS0495298.1 hypothetical protein [Pseudomonadota bacterium]
MRLIDFDVPTKNRYLVAHKLWVREWLLPKRMLGQLDVSHIPLREEAL